jgi:hypothetical protein
MLFRGLTFRESPSHPLVNHFSVTRPGPNASRSQDVQQLGQCSVDPVLLTVPLGISKFHTVGVSSSNKETPLPGHREPALFATTHGTTTRQPSSGTTSRCAAAGSGSLRIDEATCPMLATTDNAHTKC